MGRLFSVVLLAAAVMLVPMQGHNCSAQPVFFSMLFPQLIPEDWLDAQTEEVFL